MILERVFQFYKFLKENVILHPRQFGFQHSSLNCTCPIKIMQYDIFENMDNSKVTGACHLNLKKAFDTVKHTNQLKKLAVHGVERPVGWFTFYLRNRWQRTSVGNFISKPSYVSIGVPQGSVLGPLLLLIYINDLPDRLQNTRSSLFADNTAVYTTAPSADHLAVALNKDLNNVRNLLVDNRLTLNIRQVKIYADWRE